MKQINKQFHRMLHLAGLINENFDEGLLMMNSKNPITFGDIVSGQTYTVLSSFGNFEKEDKIKATDINREGQDEIRITFTNVKTGETDSVRGSLDETIGVIENLDEAFGKKPLGRRFIPEDITLSKVTRDNFKEHFKLLKLSDGDYKLYITPLMLVALESITRGRSSYETNKRLSELAKLISERIPTQIRGLLKKYAGKINSSIGLVPINTKIKEVTPNGDIVFFNPGNEKMADKAIDPTISEDFDEFEYMRRVAGIQSDKNK
jgi:hypothetical protein